MICRLWNFKPVTAGTLIIIVTVFTGWISIFAQSPVASLLKLFNPQELSENEKALICAELGQQDLALYVDSAFHYVFHGLEISLRNNYIEGQFQDYLTL